MASGLAQGASAVEDARAPDQPSVHGLGQFEFVRESWAWVFLKESVIAMEVL